MLTKKNQLVTGKKQSEQFRFMNQVFNVGLHQQIKEKQQESGKKKAETIGLNKRQIVADKDRKTDQLETFIRSLGYDVSFDENNQIVVVNKIYNC